MKCNFIVLAIVASMISLTSIFFSYGGGQNPVNMTNTSVLELPTGADLLNMTNTSVLELPTNATVLVENGNISQPRTPLLASNSSQ
jgi:hypothetical protein